MAAEPS